MSKEKQIEENELQEFVITLSDCQHRYDKECTKAIVTKTDMPKANKFYAKYLMEHGYRKQSEGEWITKHRHRGGFRTVTVVDSLGEKHTGMVDERWECDDLYCSVCGKISHDAFLNFCANCGAKMKGGAE